MYCRFCGRENDETSVFCVKCGKALADRSLSLETDNFTGKSYAFLVSILTLPIILILRILMQTEEHIPAGVNGSWKPYTLVFVPDDMKIILFVLLILSVVYSLYSATKHKAILKNRTSKVKILSVLNVIIGTLIIMMEG